MIIIKLSSTHTLKLPWYLWQKLFTFRWTTTIRDATIIICQSVPMTWVPCPKNILVLRFLDILCITFVNEIFEQIIAAQFIIFVDAYNAKNLMVRWYKRRLLFSRQNTKFYPIFWRHSRSRSRSFPGITTSHSRSRKSGMEFVLPVPVPKNWEWNLSFPFPFPKVGNAIFHSRSRSQNLGMGWAIPVPVPKVKKPFPLTPGGRGVPPP